MLALRSCAPLLAVVLSTVYLVSAGRVKTDKVRLIIDKLDTKHDETTPHGEGQGEELTASQASFTRVGWGWCADSFGSHCYGVRTRAQSLSHCKAECADSNECHAINWMGHIPSPLGFTCLLLGQKNIVKTTPVMLSGPPAECWTKQELQEMQATTYHPLLRWDPVYLVEDFHIPGFVISRKAACHNSGRIPDIWLWGCTGTCGPNWGDLTKCKSLCDHIANCTHITYFSDGGCGIYSECSSTVEPPDGVSASTYYKGKQLVSKFERVRVVGNVTGKACNRWTQKGEPSFQLFQKDFGTVGSVRTNGQVSVILDRNVETAVWVNHTYLIGDDPPLKGADNDTLIEELLRYFPGPGDMAPFKCPITKQLFRVPVVAPDGRTYEKSALEEASNHSQFFVENFAINSLLNASWHKSKPFHFFPKYASSI